MMKRTVFLPLVILLIFGGCAQEKKSPVEGAWDLVYGCNTPFIQNQRFI
jgi:hypothetical protein